MSHVSYGVSIILRIWKGSVPPTLLTEVWTMASARREIVVERKTAVVWGRVLVSSGAIQS